MHSPESQPRRETKTSSEAQPKHELHKRLEQFKHNPEQDRLETAAAKQEALHEAVGKEQYSRHVEAEKAHSGAAVASKATLKQSFGKTMQRVQSELPVQERVFSKFIHLPSVEKVSDVVASTIARPNAIVSGSLCALIFTGALYLLARYFGFSLSGSETIAAFAAGWLVGTLFDVVRNGLRNRN